MPRSAVRLSQSTESYAQELHQKAQSLEQQLTALASAASTTSKNDDRGGQQQQQQQQQRAANQLRVPLCEALSDLILTDPALACQCQATERLWRKCFYERIGPMRSRIAKEKKRKQQQKSNTTNTTIAQLQESMTFFLTEAITLYQFMISKLQSHLCRLVLKNNNNNNNTTHQEGEEASTLASSSQDTCYSLSTTTAATTTTTQQQQQQQHAPTTTKGMVECLHRLFVHLGDLYRYSNNYPKAEAAYTKAAALGPGYGNPYNQLAVTTQVKTSSSSSSSGSGSGSASGTGTATPPNLPLTALALYWYARSLLATQERFDTSRPNLERLWNSNREWLVSWQQQQQQQQQQAAVNDNNDSTTTTTTSKSTSSRRFLANYVDLQSLIYHYHNDDAASAAVIIETKLNDVMTAFSHMLEQSALGDSLLCKMVTIQAFVEATAAAQNEKNNNNTASAMLLARRSTLHFGTVLADRVLVGLEKLSSNLQQQQQQQTSSSSTSSSSSKSPSVRLLLPLMLLTEYLQNNSQDMTMTTASSSSSDRRCQELHADYWTKIARVLNLLRPCAAFLDLEEDILMRDDDENNSTEESSSSKLLLLDQLKEYRNLRGYAPFASFLKPVENGFLSDREAVQVLDLNNNNNKKRHGSQGSSAATMTQDSTTIHSTGTSSGNLGSSDHHQSRIKVARFLVVGERLANDTTSEVGQHFLDKNGQYHYVVVEQEDDDGIMSHENIEDDDQHEPDDDDDVPMFDDESPAKKQQQNGGEGEVDVLVYQQDTTGGPALLVPGALLQQEQLKPAPYAPQQPESTMPLVDDEEMKDAPNKEIPSVLEQMGVVKDDQNMSDAEPLVAVASVPAVAAKMPATKPTGAAILPPPGFEPRSENETPLLFAAQPGVAPQRPPGLEQNNAAASAANTQNSTLLESLHLLGDPSSLQTANPFAGTTTSTLPPLGESNIFGSSSSSSSTHQQATTSSGDAFLVQDAMGPEGASLLDSGLLNSLLSDESPKTKNPFATF